MRENYYELIIKAPLNFHKTISDFLMENFCDAVEVKNDLIIVRSEEDLEMTDFAVLQLSDALGGGVSTQVNIKKNIDWIESYKKSIKSIEVGKFFIHPSWKEKKVNAINIQIDPALAFGSGHHESTNSCLMMLDKYVKNRDKVLDVGSGSGILAIASAKLGAVVDFCDTDEVAVESSKQNFSKNLVTFNNSWIGSANKAEKKYDVVIANIIADILIMIKKDLKKTLKADGVLIMSGILDIYCDRVKKAYGEFEILDEIEKKEWRTLILKREQSE